VYTEIAKSRCGLTAQAKISEYKKIICPQFFTGQTGWDEPILVPWEDGFQE